MSMEWSTLIIPVAVSSRALAAVINNFGDAAKIFTDLAFQIVPLLAVVALLVFVFGVVRFIRSTGSETDMQKNKAILVWGVIGLFVLFTIWGIVAFFRSELGFGDSSSLGIPLLNTN